MENTKKISIVVVTFNAEKTLECTIKNIVGQTYSNKEIIIIDGCSKDSTVEIIKKYRNKIDYFVSEPDNGIYDAMNKALDSATGDFIIFMGADDVFYKENTLEMIATKLENEIICYGKVLRSEDMKNHDGRITKVSLMFRNPCHQCIFYPKNVYKNNKYNLRYKIFADWDYNLRVFNNYDFKFIDEIVSVFNTTGISSQCNDDLFIAEKKIIIKQIYNRLYYVIYNLLSILRYIKRGFRK